MYIKCTNKKKKESQGKRPPKDIHKVQQRSLKQTTPNVNTPLKRHVI